jgi:hypothetical protein
MLAALLCCALPAGLPAWTAAPALEFPPNQTAPELDPVALIERFRVAFAAWRGGDAAALDSVRALAAELCAQDQRCEIPRIVEHYASLNVEQRAEGLAFETRAQRLRERVVDAANRGLEEEDWEAVRAVLELELDQLCADAARIADLGARAFTGEELRAVSAWLVSLN